ncbi:MAG: DUF6514 family protein [Clostridiaceae bacterium]
MVIVEDMRKTEQVEEIIYNYSYHLIKESMELYSNVKMVYVQSYGIEVERQDSKDGIIFNIERNYIENISPYRHKVQNLNKLLWKNTVSPIHIVDVIGEYVDDFASDYDIKELEIAIN